MFKSIQEHVRNLFVDNKIEYLSHLISTFKMKIKKMEGGGGANIPPERLWVNLCIIH